MMLCSCGNSKKHNFAKSGDIKDTPWADSDEQYFDKRGYYLERKGQLDSIIAVNPEGHYFHERGEMNLLLFEFDSSIVDFKRSVKLKYKVKRSNRIISGIFKLQGIEDSSMIYKLK